VARDNAMQYGLLLLGEHEPHRLLTLARFAEAHNFENLWVGDEKFFRDPYVSLTYLAQHTERISLGTCVTDPYTRHPALTAMAMAPSPGLMSVNAIRMLICPHWKCPL
jgi:5,10-methylenetetrahydromethanopterin reductase